MLTGRVNCATSQCSDGQRDHTAVVETLPTAAELYRNKLYNKSTADRSIIELEHYGNGTYSLKCCVLLCQYNTRENVKLCHLSIAYFVINIFGAKLMKSNDAYIRATTKYAGGSFL